MDRRDFLKQGSVAAAAAGAVLKTGSAASHANATKPFKLKYAPHENHFKVLAGADIIDQIKFANDQGFRAWEDNRMPSRPAAEQEKIGKTLDDLGMTMGVFVAYGNFTEPTFAVKSDDARAEVLKHIREAIDIAKRVNAKWCTVVPGSVDQQSAESGQKWNRYGGPRLSEGFQTANVIDLLRRCSEILEPHGLTMVLESLNWHTNHGGVFLQYSDQAYALCKAVDSPCCKMLFDIYHQQITEGNLIPNIDACWEEIAYFQSGDNPGRKEPTSGEINYRNVFRHLYEKGWDGVIGMEHGVSMSGKEGELRLIQAYREVDDYEV
ncbi:MAG: TIM barrel protein [Verrucomicrobiae bacterium]|nr:TIM barrel protein [Verrucomicrobiae bacterium]